VAFVCAPREASVPTRRVGLPRKERGGEDGEPIETAGQRGERGVEFRLFALFGQGPRGALDDELVRLSYQPPGSLGATLEVGGVHGLPVGGQRRRSRCIQGGIRSFWHHSRPVLLDHGERARGKIPKPVGQVTVVARVESFPAEFSVSREADLPQEEVAQRIWSVVGDALR